MRAVVWIVDACDRSRAALCAMLGRTYEVCELTSADAVQTLPAASVALIGCWGSDSGTALEQIHKFRRNWPNIPLVLVVRQGCEDLAVRAFRMGIRDYLRMPFAPEEVEVALSRLVENGAAPRPATGGAVSKLIGRGLAAARLRARLPIIAATDCSVLITGETGTGKELVAELVHALSGRSRGAFVSLNCAALPDTLVESELFGFQRGAFTGAMGSSIGKIRQADGGTLLLDEVGDLSPLAQAKLLRAIENGEIQPLGASRGVRVNVRLLAATNQELEVLVEKGRFRKDLYYRLNISRIHLPPLRERIEDLPLLLDHFRVVINQRYNRAVRAFSQRSLRRLMAHAWPGNVRELKNVVESALVETRGAVVDVDDLPEPFREHGEADCGDRVKILTALQITGWNKSLAAKRLNWSRMTLYRKMAKYSIPEAEEVAIAE